MINLTIANNQTLLAKVRGHNVRPAMRMKDKKKEQQRKACRGNRWE